MGTWGSRLHSGQAKWVVASLVLHLGVGGVLLWINPLSSRQLELVDTVAISIVNLPPPIIEQPPTPEPSAPLEEDPKPKPRRDNATSPTPTPPLSQLSTPPVATFVPAIPAPKAPHQGDGVTASTRRALAGVFCNRMNEDERDAAGCPQRVALPRHLHDDPHSQIWQPRQPLQDIYERQLAANVSQNYLERQLTSQGAPQTMPGGMSAIDNTVFMDRSSDAEMDARKIENGGRPDWTAAIEKAHGR